MTFEHWLKQYLDLLTPFGDLARDYKSQCRQFKLQGMRRPRLTLEHLEYHGACKEAIEAFHNARNLYASFMVSNK